MGIITIKNERLKPIRQQHPWVFSGAIARAEQAEPADIVTLQAQNGDYLGRGYWNPTSQIQVRLLTWQDEDIDEAWWQQRILQAIQARSHYDPRRSYRLINGENDYLPGLVVDRYVDVSGDVVLVLQALTLGIDARKAMLARLLNEMLHPAVIVERSDVDMREREGLPLEKGVLLGSMDEKRLQALTIDEDGVHILVDVLNGHKTGFYLDQASNRLLLREMVAGKSVLNLFSYTGGFGLQALKAGAARVVNVDSSYDALETAERSAALNNIPPEMTEHIQADVFEYLRDVADEGQTYDVVVLDPPKFAHSRQQVDKAARGYKDINLNAFDVISPGGMMLTFSCSGAISADLFQKIVFGALADNGRQAQILQHLGPGEDHPVALTFPEGAYLKGLLLRVY
ncbi:MAG: class I SAM-dependent methyltransferase [Anaerolineae bacterium]